MKKIFYAIICLFLASFVYGQTGYDYLSRLPNLPDGACQMLGQQQNDFMKQLNAVLKDLNKAILEKRKQTKEDIKDQKNRIEQNMAQQYGLSQSDVQKLKSKNLSKEQKKAIADKMLQEKTGISMDEIAKLKTMSKEGKKEWAKGYAEQQQANLAADEKGAKSPDQIEMDKRLAKDKKTLDLMKEQKIYVDKIAAADKKFTNKMMDFRKKDSIQLVVLKAGLKPLQDEMNALPGPSEERGKQIGEEMRAQWQNYCTKITPLYLNLCRESRAALDQMMPNYDHMEDINAQLNNQTIGLQQPQSSKGLMQLEAVKAYASLLLKAFDYGAKQSVVKDDSGN